jgi:hypothetical protein
MPTIQQLGSTVVRPQRTNRNVSKINIVFLQSSRKKSPMAIC